MESNKPDHGDFLDRFNISVAFLYRNHDNKGGYDAKV
jgi:hypothetical protein